MGYKLTSLLNLPFEENINFYIFSIGDGIWKGGLQEIVDKNFDNLAREIGPNSIIVSGLEFEFHGEVVEKYLGKHYHELKNELPALLITNSHPNALTEESMRLLIPLKKAQDNYKIIDSFFFDLTLFVKGESDELLKKMESNQIFKSASEIVKVNVPVLPGFVSINVNNTVNELKKWWEKHKK